MRLTHSCARNADLIIVRARSLTKLATSAPDQECDCLANPIANFIDNIILVRIHVDFSTLADNLFMEDFDQTQLSNQLAHWWSRLESNQRHGDFQSPALPTELQRQMATRKGLEPSTSGVTGRRSNQLNYHAI